MLFPLSISLAKSALLIGAIPLNAELPSSNDVDPARVTIRAESDLHFGTFMVFGTGRRTVSANGLVTDDAIVALEGSTPSPARFTVTYDRGNQSRRVLDIEIDLHVYDTSRVTVDGIEADVSSIQTDIPGATRLESGRPIRISIPNCRTRICTSTFSVGGTLTVSRSYGGASLTVPLPVYVELVSEGRPRR
ncbi:DUF4402 domain-containing protein [Aurantiacibacter aquimixticola]|uniref:DUF4402 domain-containing protein n=1 Tax=Aurantiacibacter aquimixticola TaxID=1958945 RepID=A0A419RTN0_9SPHN|nr:DUF4402 domain-containing protein [Aurantiacibacter aquimixticola]